MMDMFLMLAFLSVMDQIWSTVKFTMVVDGGGFSQADPSELVCAKDGDNDSGREPDLLLCSIYVYALPVYLLSI